MELVDQVRVAAKGEADKLGHLVTEIGQYFEPLVVNVIGCAAKTRFDSQQQTLFLEQTKTVLESAAQLMVASKESAGNPKNTANLHQAIDENADGTKEVLDDLIQTLEEATAQHGYVTSMVDHINKAMANVELNPDGNHILLNQQLASSPTSQQQQPASSQLDENEKHLLFVEYQTKIVQLVKLMQQNIKSMSICQRTELGPCAQQLTSTFNFLIMACKGSIQACTNQELSQRIRLTTADLGKSCIELIHLAGRLQQQQGDDKMLRKEFLEQGDLVNKRVLNLLHSFKTSARGTQACINSDSAVNGIIADLNTVIMFATAGTLKAESDGDTFSNHRELILRSAKTLVEDTKSLVSVSGRAQIEQDELAECVETSVKTITRLADAVKLGSASLGSDQPEAQVLLINSVKGLQPFLSKKLNLF
jgi:talin